MFRNVRGLVLIALLGLLLTPGAWAQETNPASSRPASGPTPVAKMAGESLKYDIAFLWFSHLAEAELSLTAEKRPGIYKAVLEARTRGVASWLTRHRVQRYVSIMKAGPDGKMRSLIHESHIIKGWDKEREDRLKKFIFDYRHHLVREQVVRNGNVEREKDYPMTKDEPNDLLTAFYNFRAGFFGKVVPGGHYVIPSYGHKGKSDIIVDVLRPGHWPHRSFFPSRGLLARVHADKEEFGTGDGAIYVWFNKSVRPGRVVVENVIGMGDVRGRLRR
jgi:hypothetical protein